MRETWRLDDVSKCHPWFLRQPKLPVNRVQAQHTRTLGNQEQVSHAPTPPTLRRTALDCGNASPQHSSRISYWRRFRLDAAKAYPNLPPPGWVSMPHEPSDNPTNQRRIIRYENTTYSLSRTPRPPAKRRRTHEYADEISIAGNRHARHAQPESATDEYAMRPLLRR